MLCSSCIICKIRVKGVPERQASFKEWFHFLSFLYIKPGFSCQCQPLTVMSYQLVTDAFLVSLMVMVYKRAWPVLPITLALKTFVFETMVCTLYVKVTRRKRPSSHEYTMHSNDKSGNKENSKAKKECGAMWGKKGNTKNYFYCCNTNKAQ